MKSNSFFLGVFFGIAVAAAGVFFLGRHFLQSQPDLDAVPSQVAADVALPDYRGLIKVPAFLREEFRGPLVLAGTMRPMQNGVPGQVAQHFYIEPDMAFTLDEQGVGRFSARSIIRLKELTQDVVLDFNICPKPPGFQLNEGCSRAEPNRILAFRRIYAPNALAAPGHVDLGELSLVAVVKNTSRMPPCPQAGPVLTGTIRPTASFLKAHPPGTQLLLAFHNSVPQSLGVAQRLSQAKDSPQIVAALKSILFHWEMVKVDAAGIKFSVPESAAGPHLLAGVVAVCASGENADACLRRLYPIPVWQAAPARGVFRLVGDRLALSTCGQKNVAYHLHDFAPGADVSSLPPEIQVVHGQVQ